MMEQLSMKILSMSLMASWVILAVLLLRLAMKRLPKLYAYLLWGIVLFRLLCPAAISAPVSLLPAVVQDVAIGMPNLPEPAFSPLQTSRTWWAVIWGGGMLLFFLFQAVSWIRLQRNLATAVRLEEGVYETDHIKGAFVMGLVKPRISLEQAIDAEDRRYILAHERIHIRRRDYLVKLVWVLALMFHWFNPLVWAAFFLMCKDMEMACDEQVVKELGQEQKGDYSRTLLHLSERHSGLLLPPAFGESSTKSRIRNILKYKRPAAWARILSGTVLAVAVVTLMTNPTVRKTAISIIGGADGPTSIFLAGKSGSSSSDFRMKNVTKNFQTEEEVPEEMDYEEYEEDSWWSGTLYLIKNPTYLPDTRLYQAEYSGFLQKREE